MAITKFIEAAPTKDLLYLARQARAKSFVSYARYLAQAAEDNSKLPFLQRKWYALKKLFTPAMLVLTEPEKIYADLKKQCSWWEYLVSSRKFTRCIWDTPITSTETKS